MFPCRPVEPVPAALMPGVGVSGERTVLDSERVCGGCLGSPRGSAVHVRGLGTLTCRPSTLPTRSPHLWRTRALLRIILS